MTLTLLDDEMASCPFVRADGCIVYEDRPTACRYYPLGVASLSHREDNDGDEFYFFVNEPHCKGFSGGHALDDPRLASGIRGAIFTTMSMRNGPI